MRRYGDRGHCPSDLERARYVARVAPGVLMLFGGALFNAANLLVSGEDYASFADQALRLGDGHVACGRGAERLFVSSAY